MYNIYIHCRQPAPTALPCLPHHGLSSNKNIGVESSRRYGFLSLSVVIHQADEFSVVINLEEKEQGIASPSRLVFAPGCMAAAQQQ